MKDSSFEKTSAQRPTSGYNRREFFKGAGTAAAATAIAGGAGLAEAQEAGVAVVGPGMKKVTLDVNGQPREVAIEPRMSLLEALRYGCGLTGAKPVSIARFHAYAPPHNSSRHSLYGRTITSPIRRRRGSMLTHK